MLISFGTNAWHAQAHTWTILHVAWLIGVFLNSFQSLCLTIMCSHSGPLAVNGRVQPSKRFTSSTIDKIKQASFKILCDESKLKNWLMNSFYSPRLLWLKQWLRPFVPIHNSCRCRRTSLHFSHQILSQMTLYQLTERWWRRRLPATNEWTGIPRSICIIHNFFSKSISRRATTQRTRRKLKHSETISWHRRSSLSPSLCKLKMS